MVKIQRVQRKMKLTEDSVGRKLWMYLETEIQYMERVAKVCTTIKEIISIQFFTIKEEMNYCIIVYKD